MFKKLLLSLFSALVLCGLPVMAQASLGPLTYHGGQVEHSTQIFLVFWGNWNFTDVNGHTGTEAQNYYTAFAKAWGGSSLNSVVTQYCFGAPVGATSCDPGPYRIVNNSTSTNTSIWNDTSPIPCTVSTNPCTPSYDDLIAEAKKAAQHFGGCVLRCIWYPYNSALVILTPDGIGPQVGVCGSHDWIAGYNVNGDARINGIAWAEEPYLPTMQPNCGQRPDNYLAVLSVTLSHELAEIETDPSLLGWYDSSGFEIADKCSFQQRLLTFSDGASYWAEPLWSNAIGDCATQYP